MRAEEILKISKAQWKGMKPRKEKVQEKESENDKINNLRNQVKKR